MLTRLFPHAPSRAAIARTPLKPIASGALGVTALAASVLFLTMPSSSPARNPEPYAAMSGVADVPPFVTLPLAPPEAAPQTTTAATPDKSIISPTAPRLALRPAPRPEPAAIRPMPRPAPVLVAMSSRTVPGPAILPQPRPSYLLPPLDMSAPSTHARLRPLIDEATNLTKRPPKTLVGASSLACLAVSIYHEARDQPRLGQQAVASVILRRAEVPRWGDTICGVVQPVQFSYLNNDLSFPSIAEPAAWRASLSVAVDAMLRGPVPELSDVDHYHANYVDPYWRDTMRQVTRIGSHIFYRDPLTARSAETRAAERRAGGARTQS